MGKGNRPRGYTPTAKSPSGVIGNDGKDQELPPEFRNAIICGDSATVLRDVPPNTVDLVFTSPPYNLKQPYCGYEDYLPWEEYFSNLFRVMEQCVRVLKWGGRIVVNVQPAYSACMPTHHVISHFLMEQGMIWRGEIIWDKNHYNCKYTAWGSWQSPSSPYLKYLWEFLEVFCKGTYKKTGARENIDITGKEFKEWTVARWSIAPERQTKHGHPAVCPPRLVERVIKLFSFKGDVVLDPYNGIGTTAIVAQRLGRIYLGIDISPQYCDIARSRLE